MIKIHFFHASFSDFLKDTDRSKCYRISVKEAHIAMGNCCLDIIVKNEIPTDICDNSNQALFYAYSKFITHLNKSDFDQNVIEHLFLKCKSNIQAIVKVILNNTFQMYDCYSGLCLLYKFNLSVDIIFDSAIPLNKNVSKIFRQMPFTLAIDYLWEMLSGNDDKPNILFNYISVMHYCHLKPIVSANNFSDNEIDYILLGEVLESPLQAGDHFIDDMKSEQIFCGAWDYISGKIIHDPDDNPSVLSEAISPISFKYLLERIKPSLSFKIFLQKFAQNFESTFFIIWEGEGGSDEDDLVKDSIKSLMRVIDKYMKECKAIENDEVFKNESYYTHQVMNFGYPTFKNEPDASYRMAISYICN
ncbi:hypothetical protein BDQ17DRAFT_341846 [Cyathus striatus]|nr:hypothetical protein BDQ17DRAFT_341846 [Cyathus striatus]